MAPKKGIIHSPLVFQSFPLSKNLHLYFSTVKNVKNAKRSSLDFQLNRGCQETVQKEFNHSFKMTDSYWFTRMRKKIDAFEQIFLSKFPGQFLLLSNNNEAFICFDLVMIGNILNCGRKKSTKKPFLKAEVSFPASGKWIRPK
ncbi:hypothetical protein BSM4216_0659 [Bacillus smithii]|nr:hypothetical protein BSM4216_0659 [Bacillus smithii]